MTLDVEQHVDVKGPIGEVFKGLLHRLGKGTRGRMVNRADEFGRMGRRALVSRPRRRAFSICGDMCR